MPLYYCEVCFAVPLPQCFTYTYRPKPLPSLKPLRQKKTSTTQNTKADDHREEPATEYSEPIYPRQGQRIFASFGPRRKEGWIISVARTPPESLRLAIAAGKLELNDLKELEIVEPKPLFGPHELRLAQWLAHYYICSLGEALNCILPAGKKEKEPENAVLASGGDLLGPPARLSSEQNEAIATICANSHKNDKQDFYYLFGPTGSGKTEVFLQCMAHVLQQGKSVIYLVPEISLCHQLQEQLQQRFQQPVAVLHSHMSTERRLWHWRSLQQGYCRIVLGARSAVFAPVQKLGLIILDEEHEQSYKAGDTPRYHARQVAMRRCLDRRSLLLMGSATPSVEIMRSCLEIEPGYDGHKLAARTDAKKLNDVPNHQKNLDIQAKGLAAAKSTTKKGEDRAAPQTPKMASKMSDIKMLYLSERLAGGCFPKIETIDLRHSKTIISAALTQEIETVINGGGQAILFLNRRGYAPIVECFSCGKVQECRHCSVSLTYHKKVQRLLCHHCGFSMPLISSCNYCHQKQLEFVGFGTEQIEEELQRYFSHLRVARLDTDISRQKGHTQKVLQDFRAGQVDLLVGTQMVAKGLNFARVKLVGVVLADTNLNMPDFRAAERSFSLLVQVAGRAGRYSKDGKVLLQTYQPQSEVIKLAAALDWQNFYAKELALRQLTRYPPYSRLIRLVFRGGDARQVTATAKLWHSHLQTDLQPLQNNTQNFIELFAPCECPYSRVAKKYRYHMLLRSSNNIFSAVHQCVQKNFWQNKRNAKVYVEIDIDPSSML